MSLERTAQQLAAAAEASRLRLLVLLLGGEMAVGDLVKVVGQSQPRVSRHLRLLAEAGLLESFREGRSVHYRWTHAALDAGLASTVVPLAQSDEPVLAGDRERLRVLLRQRERDALRRSLRAGEGRGFSVGTEEPLVRALLGTVPYGDVLVMGCGAGELLRLVLSGVGRVVCTDPSLHRRQLARIRLRASGPPRWSIRADAPAALTGTDDGFDLVILEDVLAGPGATPDATLAAAARALKDSGRLLIVDRVLPTDAAFAPRLAALGFRITRREWLPGRAPDRALIVASRAMASLGRTGTDD